LEEEEEEPVRERQIVKLA